MVWRVAPRSRSPPPPNAPSYAFLRMKNPVLHRRSFTLVELLVVVGLTAILLALLMPALKSVRNQAKSVVCVSNLRQCGAAAHLYINEWNGLLIRYQFFNNYGLSWHRAMINGGYLPTNNNVSLCPSAPPYKRSAGESSPSFGFLIYGTRWDVPAEYQLFTITPPNQWTYTRASAVRNPADYPIYGDSVIVTPGHPDIGTQIHDFLNSSTIEGLLHLRHAGKANLAFLDGHVETCGPNRIVEVLKDGGTPIEVADPQGAVIRIAP